MFLFRERKEARKNMQLKRYEFFLLKKSLAYFFLIELFLHLTICIKPHIFLILIKTAHEKNGLLVPFFFKCMVAKKIP